MVKVQWFVVVDEIVVGVDEVVRCGPCVVYGAHEVGGKCLGEWVGPETGVVVVASVLCVVLWVSVSDSVCCQFCVESGHVPVYDGGWRCSSA